MRKMVLASMAIACLSGAASMSVGAQSLTPYGIFDTGIEYLNHVNAAGNSIVRIPINTGTVPSRAGFNGVQPLGNGWKAIATAEAGFDIGTGASKQGPRLFGRQIFAGLDGPDGTLTIGRQYSMLLQELTQFSLVGPNIYGFGSLDPWIPNARADNTVAYSKSVEQLHAGVTYSFGRDNSPTGGFNTPGEGTCAGRVAGNPNACAEWSGLLSYTGDPWGVGIGYDSQNGGPGNAVNMFNGMAPLPFTSSANHDTRLLIDGNFKIGSLKLAALLEHRRVDPQTATPEVITSNQATFEGLYQFTDALSVEALYQHISNKRQDTRANMEMANITYLLFHSTAIYANFALLQNSAKAGYSISLGGSTPAPGTNQLGTMVGIRYSF
jgi:predicted porin